MPAGDSDIPITMPRSPTDQVHEQLLQAAVAAFNREGFHGTDSNRIAKAAGLAAGTFYRHFKDKRAAFVAASQRFAAEELAAITSALEAAAGAKVSADRLLAATGEVYKNWRVFRASLRLLTASDPKVRDAHRKQRSQLLDALGARKGSASRERDALALMLLERAGDAIAEGESKPLQLDGVKLSRDLASTLERLLAG